MMDPPTSDDDFSGFESEEEPRQREQSTTAILDKDSDEEELERLVLGNKAGFRESLFKGDDLFSAGFDADAQAGQLTKTEDASGFEDVDDADLFMLDTGAPTASATQGGQTDKKDVQPSADAPAWVDSDDDRIAISLAGATRLRKLRVTEAEDVVSGTEYSRRLRQQYQRLHPAPAWTKSAEGGRPTKRRRRSSAASSDSSMASGSGDEDDDDADVETLPLAKLLRDVNLLAGRGGSSGKTRRLLRPETIDIQRTREIPDRHAAAVENLSFHPKYPVLLSCSTASVLYLHHIAPEAHPTPNPRLTSVQAKQVDVRRAEFLYPQGDRVFFAGRRRFFHHWDLPSGAVRKTTHVQGHRLEHRTMERFRLSPCGRYMGVVSSSRKGGGIVNILSTGSMQWLAAARLSSHNGIADFAWWSTGDGMTILGKDGQVGEYSVSRRKFLGIWIDEGSVGAIVVALGGHQGPASLGEDRWVAVGSNSGITNIYERSQLIVPGKGADADADEVTIKERPEATRSYEQLVTPITSIAFSPDGQLMAFGSQQKKDALKLVHLPSCTVYRNWPTEETPLGRITSIAFGRQSDLLAVGNDAGRIRLWQIRN
jgi:WD40 repeat protein